jgi:glycosyltransferase involved in cell wall biosynthesis
MVKRKYLIALHASYNDIGDVTYGPPHHIYDFLKSKGTKVELVSHSLSGNHKTEITDFSGSTFEAGQKTKNYFLNLLLSIYLDVFYCWSGKDIYIGVNPINGFSGSLLKIFRRVETFIYFSADYADKRFSNPLANFIYHFLDRVSLKFADEIWGVSTRIQKKRKEQGVPDYKNKFLPNSPSIKDIPHKAYNGNHDLVIVSHLSKSLHLKPVLLAVKRLSKDYPSIKLKIVGSGPEEARFKKDVEDMGLSNKVIFLGQKDHKEVLGILSNSFIGFALYTLENSWNYYGDSMKAREYLACGLPVIINNVPSTADDVKKSEAGLVLDSIQVNTIASFIDRCIKDSGYFLETRENSLKLAKDFDKDRLLGILFKNYI